MMKTNTLAVVFHALFALSALGQIDQRHPELCAKPGGVVALPPNVSATVDQRYGHADLFLGSGASAVKISIPGVVDDVEEVCPLPDGRLVLFGGTYNSTNVDIIDPANASLLDSFHGFDPTMSPDQRWLVYRKFYPRHTELPPSEEYLLYDLTKTPAQNRRSGARTDDRDYVGIPIFPLVPDNLPFNNIGLPENQQHESRSKSFDWSPDSRAIVFGDIVQGEFSIVLVTLDGNGKTTTLVRPVPVSEVCAQPTAAGQPVTLAMDGLVVWAGEGGNRLIRLSLVSESRVGSVCPPKTLELRAEDFNPAKAEIHVEPKRKAVVVDQE